MHDTKADSPRARFNALTPDKKARLLDPAEREFIAHGFKGASLNQILHDAGMSKGQAYYYISSKAELYLAVCERAFALFGAKAGPVPGALKSPAHFWQQVEELVTAASDSFHVDPTLATLGRSIYESTDAETALAPLLGQLENYVGRWIILGQNTGAIRTDMPNDLLFMLLFSLLRKIDRWFAMNYQTLSDTELTQMNAAALQLLRAAASPPHTPADEEVN